jgi:hypothetical protein
VLGIQQRTFQVKWIIPLIKLPQFFNNCIEKMASIGINIGNIMIYLPGKLETIDKTINNVAGRVESVTGMLSTALREKVEQYKRRGTTSKYFGYTVGQRGQNQDGRHNNQSRGGHVNQAAPQLFHDFSSNRNTYTLYFYFFTSNLIFIK